MARKHDTANPADDFAPPELGDTAIWTEQRIRALGAVTDLPTAASIFGLGRSLAYELAKHDQFLVPVIRAGTRYRVPVAAILAALHVPAAGLDPTGERSVDHHQEIRSPDHTNTGSPE
ncbi:MAG: DNA-binding protein [Micromonosporaceae bacterium]